MQKRNLRDKRKTLSTIIRKHCRLCILRKRYEDFQLNQTKYTTLKKVYCIKLCPNRRKIKCHVLFTYHDGLTLISLMQGKG